MGWVAVVPNLICAGLDLASQTGFECKLYIPKSLVSSADSDANPRSFSSSKARGVCWVLCGWFGILRGFSVPSVESPFSICSRCREKHMHLAWCAYICRVSMITIMAKILRIIRSEQVHVLVRERNTAEQSSDHDLDFYHCNPLISVMEWRNLSAFKTVKNQAKFSWIVLIMARISCTFQCTYQS